MEQNVLLTHRFIFGDEEGVCCAMRRGALLFHFFGGDA
jgi:hypothetical protein